MKKLIIGIVFSYILSISLIVIDMLNIDFNIKPISILLLILLLINGGLIFLLKTSNK